MMNPPRLIEIIRFSLPGCWYEILIHEEFTVMDRFEDYYIVDTWNGYGEHILEFIKITDCKTVEK